MGHTRQALLDAAREAAVGAGWARARMADVAASAGLSRQTLYAEFGSKDGLARALAEREVERFAHGAEAARAGAPTPVAALTASLEWTLRAAADDPLIKAVLTDDGLLPWLTTRAGALQAVVRARHEEFLRSHWPDLPAEDVALLADTLFRLTVSHLVSPTAPPETTARRLVSLVVRLLPSGDPA